MESPPRHPLPLPLPAAVTEVSEDQRRPPRIFGTRAGEGEIQALAKEQARQGLGLPDQVEEEVQVVDGQMHDGPAVPVGQGHPLGEAPRGRIGAAASVGQPVTQHHREPGHRALRPQRDPKGPDRDGVEVDVELPAGAAAAVPVPWAVK